MDPRLCWEECRAEELLCAFMWFELPASSSLISLSLLCRVVSHLPRVFLMSAETHILLTRYARQNCLPGASSKEHSHALSFDAPSERFERHTSARIRQSDVAQKVQWQTKHKGRRFRRFLRRLKPMARWLMHITCI